MSQRKAWECVDQMTCLSDDEMDVGEWSMARVLGLLAVGLVSVGSPTLWEQL